MAAHILIIEDTPHNMDLMRYLLKARGHTIAEATRGGAGVETAVKERPDLIVVDLQLPDFDGYEVLRRIRRERGIGRPPMIAVTAFAMVGDRDRVLAAGFDGYMTKPLDPQTFAVEVESFLSEAQRGASAPQTESPAQAGDGEIRSGGEGKTVLVVDNLYSNLDLTKSVLEPFGYRVISANSVNEALKVVSECKPDLILSDVHMPGEDGFVLLQTLHDNPATRRIPFVFLSSTAQESVRAQVPINAGFIARPIEPRALLAKIEEMLRGSVKT
jgi:two-component system cell cycle response regulator